MHFVDILREERKKLNLTQAQVASYLNIAVSTYTKYETGGRQPDFHMLTRLANFFDVTTDYLLGHVPDTADSTHNNVSVSLHDEKELLLLYRTLSEQGKGKLQERAKIILEDESIAKVTAGAVKKGSA